MKLVHKLSRKTARDQNDSPVEGRMSHQSDQTCELLMSAVTWPLQRRTDDYGGKRAFVGHNNLKSPERTFHHALRA